MTRKELQEVKKDYSRQIKAMLESPQDMTKRGQRLWAFSQALKEAEE